MRWLLPLGCTVWGWGRRGEQKEPSLWKLINFLQRERFTGCRFCNTQQNTSQDELLLGEENNGPR